MKYLESIANFFLFGWKKILMYIGIFAMVLALGGYAGYEYRDGKIAKEVVSKVVKDVKTKEVNQDIADTAGKKLEKKKAAAVVVKQSIDKRIDEYVEKDSSGSDLLGHNWVCIYNASAEGKPIADGECQHDATVSATNQNTDTGRNEAGASARRDGQ